MKVETQLKQFTPAEREELARMAKKANMTLSQYVEYFQKAIIYRHAEERLGVAA